MKRLILLAGWVLLWCQPVVWAGTVGYIPMDNRPVNLAYVADTARAAGVQVQEPAEHLLASREQPGQPEKLWDWVFAQAPQLDALVLSTDSLVYGGLVPSRTHFLSESLLQERLERFRELKRRYPAVRLYGFGTIMRTPKMSAGATEPPYYEKLGPKIFRITYLEDKQEITALTAAETAELSRLLAEVPAENLADWRTRRAKNYRVNEALQTMAREGVFEYFLLGRDDSSPLSASHQEARRLDRSGTGIPASRYQSIPGADNLGMSMVVNAINDLEYRIPFVKVFYAPGAGDATVASYEDHPLQDSIPQHVAAAGGIKLDAAQQPDLVLAVNTPENGVTREANAPGNTAVPGLAVKAFVARTEAELDAGRWVAVGDVAFANGADNSLMARMQERGLLMRLAAYSGWNTAGNTLGYAVGQGMLAPFTPAKKRLELLAVRYLDDWAYQANIRGELYNEIVYPAGNDGQYLGKLLPRLRRAAAEKTRRFAGEHLQGMANQGLRVDFPWNRMFEIEVHVH